MKCTKTILCPSPMQNFCIILSGLILFAPTAFLSSAWADDVYTWEDDGVVSFSDNPMAAPNKAVKVQSDDEAPDEAAKVLLNRIVFTLPPGYSEAPSQSDVHENKFVFTRTAGKKEIGRVVILLNERTGSYLSDEKKKSREGDIYAIYRDAYRQAERLGDYAPKFVVLAGHKAVSYENGLIYKRREYQTYFGNLYAKFTLFADNDAELKIIDQYVHKTRVAGTVANAATVDNTASIEWFRGHIYYSPPAGFELDKKLTKDGSGKSSIYYQKVNNDGDMTGSITFMLCDIRLSEGEFADKVMTRQVSYPQQIMEQAKNRHESGNKNAKLITIAGRQAFSDEGQTTGRSKRGIIAFKYKYYTLQLDNVIVTIMVQAINAVVLAEIESSIQNMAIANVAY